MPKLNGLDMAKSIRKIDNDIPIIIFSAHEDINYFLDAISVGIDAYILKPLNLEKFLISVGKSVRNIVIKKENLAYKTLLEEKVNEQILDLREKEKLLLQQSKLAQMGDMVSMIAHQWRQPLNAISASSINLSLLSGMGILEDEKVSKSSEFIQEQCQKMSNTIDTFMNFVQPSKEKKTFTILNTVEAIMQIMGTQLASHNIKVNILTNGENIEIQGHEDLLEQVLINILSNARDAFDEQTIENKCIEITIEKQQNRPALLIKDNAGGVPKNIADKIFNPYFTTKEQGKGTGIGLFMSMDIMKKSFDGDLVYKATDGGSSFTLIFS